MPKKSVCCWDLEGPISIIDFAAEIGKLLGVKSKLNLNKFDMSVFFTMISNYDDYIIEVPGVKEELNIPNYQPGDTLRLMAPLYLASYTDKDLIKLAKSNFGLLPGCRELMNILHKNWEIYIISTSYSHFAHNVTASLGISRDHVYCTDFNIKKLKRELQNIENDVEILINTIFQKYLENNKDLNSIIKDLNNFFWRDEESDYVKAMNLVEVRGGKRKEIAVEEISKRTDTSISEVIALGDSITDINMLQRVNDEGGIAVSFNGNRFSLKRANVAVTTINSLGVLPIFNHKSDLKEFLYNWESNFDKFNNNPKNIPNSLILNETKELFTKYNLIPELVNLKGKTEIEYSKIVTKQEKIRKLVRGWAGNLG
ncbi:MAG: HAD hydrolase family protein [Promethearchaeota archaeon]